MGHKTLIGGTAYDITGGKTLIGGTAYNITGGKTLVGGTVYDISFVQREQTFPALMAAATLVGTDGENSSSTKRVNLSFGNYDAGTYYVMSFCNGYMSINKVVYDGTSCTKTVLGGNYTSSYGNIYCDGNTIYYSADGSSSTRVYGATISVLLFEDYTETEISNIVSNATFTRLAGVDDDDRQNLGCPFYNGYMLASYDSYIAYNEVTSAGGVTNIFGNYPNNPALLGFYTYSTNFYLYSYRASMNGGSMIQVS